MNGRNTTILPFLISIFITIQIKAQTVFVFNKTTTGVTYDFQNAATWANNAVPQDGDVLSFLGVNNNNVNNIPDLRFSKVINDGAVITLQPKTGGSSIIVDELVLNKDISVSSTAGPNLLYIAIGTISGANSGIKITNNGGAYVTVTGVYYDKGTSFLGTWAGSRLSFGINSMYKGDYNMTSMPLASWGVGSTASITGLISTTGIGNVGQNFYNFFIDSPGLALSTITSINMNAAAITCSGIFKTQNLSGKIINVASLYLNDFHHNDGTIALGFQANLNIVGNVTQTGGAFTYNSAKIVLNGISNQRIGFTNVSNGLVVLTNTGVSGNNNIILSNNISLANVTLLSGNLSLNGYNLSIAGSIVHSGFNIDADENSGLYISTTNTYIIPTITGAIGRLFLTGYACSGAYINLGSNTTVAGIFSMSGTTGCTEAALNINNVNLFIAGEAYLNNRISFAITGTGLTFGSNSKFIYAKNGGTMPLANFIPGSVVSITGITANGINGVKSNTYYDFILDSPAQTGKMSVCTNTTGDVFNVTNTLTIKSGILEFGVYGNGTNATCNINLKNLVHTGGTLYYDQFANIALINTNISGDYIIGPAAIHNLSSIAYITLTGTNSVLSMPGNNNNITGSVRTLIINKNTNDDAVTLATDVTTPYTILVQSGNLSLNGYNLIVKNGIATATGAAGIITGGGTSSITVNVAGNTYLPTVINGLNNLTVNNRPAIFTGTNTIIGILSITGGTGALTFAAGSLVMDGSSTMVYNRDGGTIPLATWNTGSTCSITGYVSSRIVVQNNQVFYNLVFNNPAQTGNYSILTNNQIITVLGTFGVQNTGNGILRLNNAQNENANYYINNFSFTGGKLYALEPVNSLFFSVMSMSIAGNYFQAANTLFNKSFAPNANVSNFNIEFVGEDSYFENHGSLLGANIYIHKNNITNKLNLLTDLYNSTQPTTLTSLLTFKKGIIAGNGFLTSITGNITASSLTGWVYGSLGKTFSVSGVSQVKVFETGSSTAYMPVTLSTPGISAAGSVIVGISEQEHPQILQGCINASKGINKYWSVKSLEGTLSPFNFNAVLRYNQATDLDAAANVANLNEFVYNGSSWSIAAAPAFSSNAISITGLSASGDYYFAESGPDVSSISGSSVACQDAAASTYSVTGNTCTTSYSWTVAGGSLSGTGNSVNVIWTTTGINHIYASSSDGATESGISVFDVTVTGTPDAPSAIAGTAEICEGSTPSYSVTSMPGLSYAWTVTGGSMSVSGVNTSITWTTVGINSIAVSASNQCYTGPATLQVTTVFGTPAQTSAIAGTTEVCQGISFDYSVSTIDGLTYNWTVSGGSLVQNGGMASITWTASGINSVSVSASNACFTSVETMQSITVTGTPDAPSAISGSFDVCQGNDDYSITTLDGLNYSWTVTGGSFSLNGGTTSITWTSPGINSIVVSASNICFTSAETTQAVTVTGTPAMPSAIAGAPEVCENSTHDYSITTIDGLSYSWTVTGGTFSVSGETASINWTASGINSIAVSASNACFTSSETQVLVTVGGILSAPAAILGITEVCEGSNHDYTVNTIDGLSYSWSVTGGSFTINDATISVVWTAPGVNSIAVTASSSCFTSVPTEQFVTVTGTPDALSSIAGAGNVIVSSQNITYSVVAVSGLDYIWTITGGGTLIANGNTATVIWSTPGNYTISVIPANACTQGPVSQMDVTVDQFTISVSAPGNEITENEGTLQLSASANSAVSITGFTWSVSDTSLASVSPTGLVSALANGIVTITVFVTEKPAIQAQYMITISGQGVPTTITGPSTTTGIAGTQDNQVSISPNPASSSFTLYARVAQGEYSVELYNLEGTLLVQKIVNGLTSVTISTDTLSNGVYFVKVKSGIFNRIERLVISK